MKSKTLVTMLGVGLLAGAAVPALAAHDLVSQLQMTDGYTEPATTLTPRVGAAGWPGKASDQTKVAKDTWFLKQLQQTDGFSEPATISASRAGAAGRSGKSVDDKWLERQLRLSDGSNN